MEKGNNEIKRPPKVGQMLRNQIGIMKALSFILMAYKENVIQSLHLDMLNSLIKESVPYLDTES